MIHLYRVGGVKTALPSSGAAEPLGEDVVWIDMLDPTEADMQHMESLLGVMLPTRETLKNIEPSSRYYTEGNAVYMTASIVMNVDFGLAQLTDVGFILAEGRLVTIRHAEPKPFFLFAADMKRLDIGPGQGVRVLAHLLDTIVDRTAEILELAVAKIDNISIAVFGEGVRGRRRPPAELEERLIEISTYHRLVSKTRDSLITLARLSTYVQALGRVRDDKPTKDLCRIVAHDIQSLSEHASFVSSNISFLLDSSLGLVNLEQNNIMKLFSVVSVVFAPPMLIAGIYGMNFDRMPELHWAYGYPAAVAAMLLTGVLAIYWLRSRGWF
ncbi:magnesium transporter CorA family protein [Martelella lutilitoris]|uniref:Magnesium transport protein CorA n=1 Tax=Martelella lutilitoris TaxID=2583532 RepID=A0A7T7HLB1_9HYPH|nr:magnesium transporter CorA family protein [Martelella lutilitoris]QQM31222.1 magnesium transporter CorA family protein [Martelella lutilitoris]